MKPTKVPGFVNSDLSKQETKQTFLQLLTEVKYDDPFRNTKTTAIKNQNEEECNALKKEKGS